MKLDCSCPTYVGSYWVSCQLQHSVATCCDCFCFSGTASMAPLIFSHSQGIEFFRIMSGASVNCHGPPMVSPAGVQSPFNDPGYRILREVAEGHSASPDASPKLCITATVRRTIFCAGQGRVLRASHLSATASHNPAHAQIWTLLCLVVGPRNSVRERAC